MSVLSFIKENRVLVAGLVLPLLLIGVLAIAKSIPSSITEPPQHQVVYYSAGWSPKGQLTLKVDDTGHLVAEFKKNDGYKATPNETAPKTILYIYDPKTNIAHDTELTLGTDDALPSLDKFSNLTLSKEQTSSDGYIFEQYHYRNNSLITEIFAYHSSDNGPVLSKGGKLVKLPLPTQNYGNNQFVGWVSEGDVK